MVCTAPSFSQARYWVFFKDKPNAAAFSRHAGGESAEAYLVSNGILTKRAIERRLKVLPQSEVVSKSDFPVYTPYLDSLRSVGLQVVGTSRWFNAAVVVGDSARLTASEVFPFVVGIKKVATGLVQTGSILPPPAGSHSIMRISSGSLPPDTGLYGPSYPQFALSGIPQVHALGINGTGVLVGMLDTGFRYEGNDALENVKIVGEHDFIQHDSITENQPGDASDQDSHGTSTLSVLGGYAPGKLIGVANGADFMLAKTEYVPVTDYKWEESNWVEGLEWMESRGVDVVSSSVAYSIFVDSSGQVDSAQSYYWSRGDFNGKTAISSIAASHAARLGVIVVQAMGNEGNGNGTVGTMLVPADADSIISVGAVDENGDIASFSSTGPTNDGRIKPDLVADGVNDYVATVPGPDTYAYESGTSFSTPITAGIAALILSVRPDYTPMQVIDLLEQTAIRSQTFSGDSLTSTYPNNFYGWGIVNAWNAIKKIGFVGSNSFTFWEQGSALDLAVKAFSTAGVDLALSRGYFSTDGINYKSVPIFQTDTLYQVAFSAPQPSTPTSHVYFYFDLVDSSGRHLDVPYDGAQSAFDITGWMVSPESISGKFLLFDNYPNPFSSTTNIGLMLKEASSVKIEVYDILGRKIKTIFDGSLPSGYQQFAWNGSTNHGRAASSGVYLVTIDVDGSVKTQKVLYLK